MAVLLRDRLADESQSLPDSLVAEIQTALTEPEPADLEAAEARLADLGALWRRATGGP